MNGDDPTTDDHGGCSVAPASRAPGSTGAAFAVFALVYVAARTRRRAQRLVA